MATSGSYNDLDGQPPLGSLAAITPTGPASSSYVVQSNGDGTYSWVAPLSLGTNSTTTPTLLALADGVLDLAVPPNTANGVPQLDASGNMTAPLNVTGFSSLDSGAITTDGAGNIYANSIQAGLAAYQFGFSPTSGGNFLATGGAPGAIPTNILCVLTPSGPVVGQTFNAHPGLVPGQTMIITSTQAITDITWGTNFATAADTSIAANSGLRFVWDNTNSLWKEF